MTQQQSPGENSETPLARVQEMRVATHALFGPALDFCSPKHLADLVRKWLTHAEYPETEAQSVERFAYATILATELTVFAPSMSGTRPIDRMMRKIKPNSPIEQAAFSILAKAKFTLFRFVRLESDHIYIVENLASGENFRLVEKVPGPSPLGLAFGARLCRMDDGLHFSSSPVICLESSHFAAARDFIRPGVGLTNDQRCAAAVYKNYIRHGALGEAFFGWDEDRGPCLSYPDDELDDFVDAWAEVDEGPMPMGEALADARSLTRDIRIICAVVSSVEWREFGDADYADIYRNLALIMMETLHARGLAGSGEANPLDSMRDILAEEKGKGKIPAAALNLFEELRKSIVSRAPPPRRSAASDEDDDLGRIIERIRGLRAKTTAQGCTEQEALAAADKVAEMLERYGLSLSEIDLRNQPCQGVGVDTGRRRMGPPDRCMPYIALFCDCRTWSELNADGLIRFIFFGLPADVEAALYLYDLVTSTFKTETAAFKTGAVYAELPTGERRGATSSFQLGLALGINHKLDKLKSERQKAMQKSSGRDLVPLKASIIDDEMGKLGLSLSRKNMSSRRKVLETAYRAGQAAGSQFEPHASVEAAESQT